MFTPIRIGLLRQIIHARADDTHGTRDKFCRTGAPCAMGCHIIHLAVKARVKPLLQLFVCTIKEGIRNAQIGKAERYAPLPDVLREFD
jgi:hypothetical protein